VLLGALDAVYVPGTPGTFASTLTANAPSRLADILPSVSNLRAGDRVLVAGGVTGTAARQANGVYTVTNLGSNTAKWVLTRAADSDTADDLPNNAYVRVGDGSTFDTVYRLTYMPTPEVPFGRVGIDVAPVGLPTEIGSEDPNEIVQYVVSTAGATNLAAGSLGKTLLLSNANDPVRATPRFMFSRDVGQIDLAEELPPIQRPDTSIDGAVRYPEFSGETGVSEGTDLSPPPVIFIVGSRMTRTYDGKPVTPATAYRGLQVEADGAKVANLNLGGFVGGTTTPNTGSAAIKILGGEGIVVDGVTVGASPTPSTQKLGSTYGIVVGAGSENATISKSVIVASTAAGVRIEGDATGTTLDYNTIGQSGKDNRYGVEVDSTGANRINKGNKIERNLWGVRLVNGTTTIGGGTALAADANQITNNVYAGVLIEGGTATIGTAIARSPGSNQIVTNQGWGILVRGTTLDGARTLADGQTLQGNYFVPPNAPIGDTTA
jgi:hypothetical protein